MYEGFWKQVLVGNLMVPFVVIIFGIFLGVAKHYADKLVAIFTERHKVESVEKIARARESLVKELDTNVQAAVASNMDMADKMKAAGHKLTDEEILQINSSAKEIVFRTLPQEISGMTPSEILGGDTVTNALINSLMEKHVLEYKIKRGMKTNHDDDTTMSAEIPQSAEMEQSLDGMDTSDLPVCMHDCEHIHSAGVPEHDCTGVGCETCAQWEDGAMRADEPQEQEPAPVVQMPSGIQVKLPPTTGIINIHEAGGVG
ncbi:MAG: hypothetical protein K2N48_07200 [Muribaculaceae bacterium]|nr:hypothetical protein [Muribaculaceae bacterium]